MGNKKHFSKFYRIKMFSKNQKNHPPNPPYPPNEDNVTFQKPASFSPDWEYKSPSIKTEN
jgi:hypothetical protein